MLLLHSMSEPGGLCHLASRVMAQRGEKQSTCNTTYSEKPIPIDVALLPRLLST